MVNKIILPLIASTLTSYAIRPLLQKTYNVFDENCQLSYRLFITGEKSRLVDVDTGKVLENWSKADDNPYLKDKFGFLIYSNDSSRPYLHLAVKNETLYDLDNSEVLEFEADICENIYSELHPISYSNIPIEARFCDYAYYFRNIDKSCFGENKNKTCTMVALQILLGYYDSIWNDNVVEEIYDAPRESSSTYCSGFFPSPATKANDFFDYLIKNCNSYCKVSIENDGLSNINQNHFINHYIGEIRNLEYANNTSEGNWSDLMSNRQYGVLKDGINAGRPVIINTLAHSMLAFAYDDNFIYVMTGWYSNVMAKISWGAFSGNIFTNYCAAYDLILKTPHYHSNNYYSISLGKFICPLGDL